MIVKVKNMVCDRCKTVLMSEFSNASISIEKIALGEIVFPKGAEKGIVAIKEILTRNGFEMIDEPEALLVADVKCTCNKKFKNMGH